MDGGVANFHGNPFLDDRVVIVGSDIPPEGEGHLYAFAQRSGAVRWKRLFPGGVAVDVLGRDGNIFVVTLQGEAVCLAEDSGEILWRYDGIKGSRGPLGAGSLLLNDAFIFTAEREVLALRATTGELLWHNTLDSWVNTSIIAHGGKLYVGDISGGLHRLSPQDGSVEATFTTGGMLYGSLSTCASGVLALWQNEGSEGDGTPFAPHTLACLGSSLEKLRWRRDSDHEWTTYRPLVGEVSVVVGNESGEMVELQTTDGAELWSTKIQGVPRGLSFIDDGLIIGTLGGTVYALVR